MSKTYSNAELNALISEFSAEFDALVKSEVAKTVPLAKAEGDEPEPKKEAASPSPEASSPSADASPAPESTPAESPPASPEAAPADPASASPEAGAAGTDPHQALVQAYSQLAPEELQQHAMAMAEVIQAKQGAGAPGPEASMPPPGATPAGAPMAGEGSKPVDPMASMAMKSEFEKELSLLKSERDAAVAKTEQLSKSVEALTETLTKAVSQPVRKSVTGKDLDGLLKSEVKAPSFDNMSKAEITKKLLAVAATDLKKSDRDLINSFYKGTVKVDALAHLLGN